MPITVQKYKKIWGENAYDDIFFTNTIKITRQTICPGIHPKSCKSEFVLYF